jgi:hypothetical protein
MVDLALVDEAALMDESARSSSRADLLAGGGEISRIWAMGDANATVFAGFVILWHCWVMSNFAEHSTDAEVE